MLGWMIMIAIVVWAIKELAGGLGIDERIKYGKQNRPNGD